MSDHSIPKTIDPLKYADQRRILEGQLPVDLLPRLTEILASSEGDVDIKLEFGRDEQNLRVVQGELDSELSLHCERCLNPVRKRIESRFVLGIVLDDEQAKNLPRAYEPLLVEPESLDIYELIEEEMILSLPMFSYHDNCELEYDGGEEEASEEEEVEKPNPFSVLSELKLKK